MADWSPETYLLFEAERTWPVNDLLAAVPPGAAIGRAADIGCGPGNSTEVLRNRFPNADISGIDSSGEMLAAARARLPELRFEQADIRDWAGPETFDLILANAVLQWVPDHERLLPRLLGRLEPGGTLAVQMPDNQDEPTHRLMRDIARDQRWAGELAEAETARAGIGAAAWYYTLLKDHGAKVTLWKTTYFQPLAGGVEAIVTWFSSTGLRPFLGPLDTAEREGFLARYRAALAEFYQPVAGGEILLPSPRLFIVATLRA